MTTSLLSTIPLIQATPANQQLRELLDANGCEAGRQGDIYLRKYGPDGVLSYAFPFDSGRHSFTTRLADFTLSHKGNQLAQGVTKGSRHCMVLNESVQILTMPNKPSPLVGPVVRVMDKARLEHPEHAHFDLGCGDYQVTYQADYAADEIRAVRD